jgi:prophage antirepressor-like protein
VAQALEVTLFVPSEISPDGSQVRTRGDRERPLFCLADVCQVLGNSDHRSVARRLGADEKGVQIVHTPGGPQETLFVNEAGLYHVVLTSRAKNADPFRRWVCHEVLPCIRKHGCYPAQAQQEEHPSRLDRIEEAIIKLAQAVASGHERQAAPQFVPTGQAVGIADRVRQLWRTASKRQREVCVRRVSALCRQRGIEIWQPLPNGPIALQERHASIIHDVVCQEKELAESPLFNQLA